VLAACRELNVALIPCVPLAVGVLTGKYWNSGTRMPGFQKAFFRAAELDPFHERGPGRPGLLRRLTARPAALGDLSPVFEAMHRVAKEHGLSLVQVALNWLLAADPLVIPIPGAKNAEQARENAGALQWRMTPEERDTISAALAP
jgi:aryl-alcohol dehydrogenase-like predicted oxidoreductase